MSLADEIKRVLASYPAGLPDAALAKILNKRHQHVNQVCRDLAGRGDLRRHNGEHAIVNILLNHSLSESGPSSVPSVASLVSRSWDWEGNVQAALCRWLVQDGWSLIQVIDTASHRPGTDIIAELADRRLFLEVKGYPAATYADPRRAHETKPTRPSMQARHWYAGVLLSAVQLRDSHPDDRVAIGLPDAAIYRALVEKTKGSLGLLRIEIFIVMKDGAVAQIAASGVAGGSTN